jgi:hypothetical protein
MLVLACLTGATMADLEDELPPSDRDVALLRALGEALDADPMPEGLLDRATALLAVVDLDADLVALLQELAGTRGSSDLAAPLAFVTPDGAVTIEIELDRGAVIGQLVGADAVVVTLERTSGASVDAPVEALGRFRFAAPSPGPARLRVRIADTTISTDWFVV